MSAEESSRFSTLSPLIHRLADKMGYFQSQTWETASLAQILQTLLNTTGQILQINYGILCPFEADSLLPDALVYPPTPSVSLDILKQTLPKVSTFTLIEGVEHCSPSIQESYQILGIKSSVVLPLHYNQKIVAELALYHCDANYHWCEEHLQLAVMVAHQMQLLFTHGKAYQRMTALAQREALINTVTAAIRASLDPQQIFKAITHQLGNVLGVDGCALSLWTKADTVVCCVGLYDRYTQEIDPLPQSVVPIARNPVLQSLLKTLAPIVLADMTQQPDFNQFDLPLRKNARALLIVPLIVDGEIIGSISLRQTETPRYWSKAEIELAQAVASQAAIAVQQAHLYETTKAQAQQLRESEQRVKHLNRYLTESVLNRFLPATLVNRVAAGELVLDLRPEPRLVTILFIDLVNFTPLASQLDPQVMATLLNDYLETMTKAVFEEGGTVDKFIGDGIVALFGAPESLSAAEQVKRAIAVSRRVYLHLAQLNQQWQAQGWVGTTTIPLVKLRCGIHQGNAVVGMFGGGQRADYTAIGLTVNLAERLQESAEANTILVSQSVADYLEATDIEKTISLRLKGFEQEVLAFSVALKLKNPPRG